MLKENRNVIARLLVVVQTRGMDVREVFKYSLGLLLWSLTLAVGFLCKAVKSNKLLETLIEGFEPAEDVPSSAALIVDGIAVL